MNIGAGAGANNRLVECPMELMDEFGHGNGIGIGVGQPPIC